MDSPPAPPEDPFAAMDPEMAAHPQPLFKMLRESMPVDTGRETVAWP